MTTDNAAQIDAESTCDIYGHSVDPATHATWQRLRMVETRAAAVLRDASEVLDVYQHSIGLGAITVGYLERCARTGGNDGLLDAIAMMRVSELRSIPETFRTTVMQAFGCAPECLLCADRFEKQATARHQHELELERRRLHPSFWSRLFGGAR